jgi:hypothetical protein
VTDPGTLPYDQLNGYSLNQLFNEFDDEYDYSILVDEEYITLFTIYFSTGIDPLYSPLYNSLFYYLTPEQQDIQMEEFITTPYYFTFSALNITLSKSIIDQFYFIYLEMSEVS